MLHRTVRLNGSNLNLLGQRERGIYECGRSEDERELMSWVGEIPSRLGGPILNAGTESHTSIALLDGLRAAKEPLIDMHLSNIYQRETFRQHSYVSLAATGVILVSVHAATRWPPMRLRRC